MTGSPPTRPPAADQPDAAPSAERLRSLEMRLKWLMIGLIACGVLVLAMAGVTAFMLVRHTETLAQQAVDERAQLQLLQQLRQDFEAMDDVDPPRNRVEAYKELREQLNTLRGFYQGAAEFDLADPEGSLDRLLGETPVRRDPPEDPPEDAPEESMPDEDQDDGGA